ncbi:MAG TPA: hypothetical protein VJZ77_12610, partial [Blastocatellia bacterium]|nr:hypothetical protein [Blastocatellia bacterium]
MVTEKRKSDWPINMCGRPTSLTSGGCCATWQLVSDEGKNQQRSLLRCFLHRLISGVTPGRRIDPLIQAEIILKIKKTVHSSRNHPEDNDGANFLGAQASLPA